MNLQDLAFLRSVEGRAWFDNMRAFDGDVNTCLRWLRKSLTGPQAGALMELGRARHALRGRHTLAESLFLDTAAAAQASSEVVAKWRAKRFAGAHRILDLCCGAGVDTLALAQVGNVLALDCDEMRIRFAQANALEASVDITAVQGLAPDCLAPIPFLFCDPDRRVDGRRVLDPQQAVPSLSVLQTIQVTEGMGIKLSPMAPLAEVEHLGELEFISAKRELKEIVLWTGALAKKKRQVSLPESGFVYSGEWGHEPKLASNLADFLLEPDPALIRSGLLGYLANENGLEGVSRHIAYLTGNRDPLHPLLKCQRILGWSKTGNKAIQKLLNSQDIGRLNISRRGYPQKPEEVRKRIRLNGSKAGHLHMTRLNEERVAILTAIDSL